MRYHFSSVALWDRILFHGVDVVRRDGLIPIAAAAASGHRLRGKLAESTRCALDPGFKVVGKWAICEESYPPGPELVRLEREHHVVRPQGSGGRGGRGEM